MLHNTSNIVQFRLKMRSKKRETKVPLKRLLALCGVKIPRPFKLYRDRFRYRPFDSPLNVRFITIHKQFNAIRAILNSAFCC